MKDWMPTDEQLISCFVSGQNPDARLIAKLGAKALLAHLKGTCTDVKHWGITVTDGNRSSCPGCIAAIKEELR